MDMFSRLYHRKSYVNWFTAEGMDEMELVEASSNVYDLISEYKQFTWYFVPVVGDSQLLNVIPMFTFGDTFAS